MLNPVSYKTYQPNFSANINSPKLKCCANDFFIKIKGYGRDENWAKEIVETAESATRMLLKDKTIEQVLESISLGVLTANKKTQDISKSLRTGILRTTRPGWICSENKEVYTPYNEGRYSIYKDRLNKTYENPLQSINEDFAMTRPNGKEDIQHGEARKINASMDYIFNLYEKFLKPFTNGSASKKDLNLINDTVAEIRWVLAHATPWLRGSDAISNVLMRALYKAVGVKSYPPAKNISFDMEAYCTELKDYKKNFPNFFEKAPKVIEN